MYSDERSIDWLHKNALAADESQRIIDALSATVENLHGFGDFIDFHGGSNGREILSKVIKDKFGTREEALARLLWYCNYQNTEITWYDLEYIYSWLDELGLSHDRINSALTRIISARQSW
jgi:hypothetical protein